MYDTHYCKLFQLQDALDSVGLPTRVQRIVVATKVCITCVECLNYNSKEVVLVCGDAVFNLFQGTIFDFELILQTV